MTPDTLERLYSDLRRDEGDVARAYRDSKGIWTVGVGHNLESRPLSPKVRQLLLEEDVNDTLHDLSLRLPWWTDLSPNRQRVLANMAFNMGIGILLTFRRFLDAVKVGDWETASDEMLHSQWAQDVGARSFRLARLMRTDAEW